MEDAKEIIRERLAIEDVIGEYVELKRAGRNLKALSPFTTEKTPSFMVSPDKKIWHDFSSGKGGDIYSFIMEIEGVDFVTALKKLADKAGVELKTFSSAKSKKINQQKQQLAAANKLAVRYYQKALLGNRHALEYAIKQRRLNKETIQKFLIGYAPNSRRGLVDLLQKRGYTSTDLNQSGLTNRFGGDLFRQRLMIPFLDTGGQVIGFTGRGLNPKIEPKYLNTPSTLLYDKSNYLFGIFQAKMATRSQGSLVLVEGNMDVLTSHQAGVENVVATSGTALTEAHARLIRRFSDLVILAFDSDAAGERASERAILLLKQSGIDVKVVDLPDGFKDPDELIAKDPTAWPKVIATARPAFDWLFDLAKRDSGLDTAEGTRDLVERMLQLVAKTPSQVEQSAYLKQLADRLGFSVDLLKQQIKDWRQTKPKKVTNYQKQEPLSDSAEQDLLALALTSQELWQEVFVKNDDQSWQATFSQTTVQFIKEMNQLGEWRDLQQASTYAKVLLLRAEKNFLNLTKNQKQTEAQRLISRFKQKNREQHQQKLTEQLRQAELAGDEAAILKLATQLNRQIKEIKGGEKNP